MGIFTKFAPEVFAGKVTVPVNVGEAIGALVFNPFDIVVKNAGSLFIADANSCSVFKRVGDEPTKFVIPEATSLRTKAVVATCVVFVPAVGVGAVGVPVKIGETKVLLVTV